MPPRRSLSMRQKEAIILTRTAATCGTAVIALLAAGLNDLTLLVLGGIVIMSVAITYLGWPASDKPPVRVRAGRDGGASDSLWMVTPGPRRCRPAGG
jgi:hypothetical protein